VGQAQLVFQITWTCVPLDLILPDQPNCVVRTRMLRGVGGAPCEGRSYPDRLELLLLPMIKAVEIFKKRYILNVMMLSIHIHHK
jgi:hypothetical protein